MSKQEAKGIAAGLLVAAILLGAYYFMFSNVLAEDSKKSTDELVEEQLNEQNMVMIKKEEYESLQASKKQLESIHTSKEKTDDKKDAEKEKQKREKVEFIIKEGMTSQEVAQSLEDQKLVKTADDFINVLREKGKETAIQPGEHELNTEMTPADIITEIAR
ncbi:endolytic transglycosylase MltG [Guptibacillus algicola]|uniref:endolytic transglycosylase MltG n=1 Tax=Guptibacillus algicola TaxID=225844 RepID=UPI001CD6FD89|nr:endolytic transglycosylase MltG [Alkalihalobacillus algicola]MCA0989099.1 endolytic transglycosylase MltG [Alkalihalobacillus algicola]